MNFKVRCLNDNLNMYDGISKGSIYEITNGKFIDDNGTTRPPITMDINSFEDFLRIYGDFCEFELVKDKFSINDLKPCMLVELRKGTLCMVVEDINGLALISKQGDSNLLIKRNYNSKLKEAFFEDIAYDIMKVWGFTSKAYQALDFVEEFRELLYERKEKTKMTIAEIEERLGMEIEII